MLWKGSRKPERNLERTVLVATPASRVPFWQGYLKCFRVIKKSELNPEEIDSETLARVKEERAWLCQFLSEDLFEALLAGRDLHFSRLFRVRGEKFTVFELEGPDAIAKLWGIIGPGDVGRYDFSPNTEDGMGFAKDRDTWWIRESIYYELGRMPLALQCGSMLSSGMESLKGNKAEAAEALQRGRENVYSLTESRKRFRAGIDLGVYAPSCPLDLAKLNYVFEHVLRNEREELKVTA